MKSTRRNLLRIGASLPVVGYTASTVAQANELGGFSDDFDYSSDKLDDHGWGGQVDRYKTENSLLKVKNAEWYQDINPNIYHPQTSATGTFKIEGAQNPSGYTAIRIGLIRKGGTTWESSVGYGIVFHQHRGGSDEFREWWKDIRFVRHDENSAEVLSVLTEDHKEEVHDVRVERDPETYEFTLYLDGKKVDNVKDDTYTDSEYLILRCGADSSEDKQIDRISTLPANRPPTARFTFTPSPPITGETITFDASPSTDPDGDDLTYEWDFTGDGDVDATGEVVTHTFTTGGEKTVTLTVTDTAGASVTKEKSFTVWIGADLVIKPGSDPNAINPASRGNIPVGILQTDSFDPTTRVDVGTLAFGAADDTRTSLEDDVDSSPTHSGHVVDLDGDDADDLVVHFPAQGTGFEDDDETGRIVGQTRDGIPLVGNDSVKIVGRGDKTTRDTDVNNSQK